MSLGRQKARQESFWVARHEMPKSPGNPFYSKRQKKSYILIHVDGSFGSA